MKTALILGLLFLVASLSACTNQEEAAVGEKGVEDEGIEANGSQLEEAAGEAFLEDDDFIEIGEMI